MESNLFLGKVWHFHLSPPCLLAGEAIWIQSLAEMALGSRIKFSCHRTCWSVHAPSSYVTFQALNTCKQKKQPAAKITKSRCDVKIHWALCHHCKMCLLDLSLRTYLCDWYLQVRCWCECRSTCIIMYFFFTVWWLCWHSVHLYPDQNVVQEWDYIVAGLVLLDIFPSSTW